jgi:hypothetical protein
MRRRAFLALGASAGAMAAVGMALFANGYRSWVLETLRTALPGYSFAGVDQFIDDHRSRSRDSIKFQLLGAAESVFGARALLPEGTRRYIDDEERDVVTEFLLGSDFFQQYPQGAREITYTHRAVACKSPFAVFDL